MALETKANSEEQKAERRRAIIGAARELFEKFDFHEISMQEVAQRAGMAKGTVFFYFKTKEELFLACAREELGSWHDRFDAMLREYQRTHESADFNIDDLVEIMIQSISNTFMRFASIVGSVLNRNVDFTVLLAHKKFSLKKAQETGKLLDEIIPCFKPLDGIRLYQYAFYFVTGLYPMAELSEKAGRNFEKSELQVFEVNFVETFREFMGRVLRGWQ